QRRAAQYDARFVTVGPLVFFSTPTGDAWMLDPSDHLAARLARDGDPEPIDFQETDTNFAIGWKGNYHIEGRAFVYADREAGRIITILWLSHCQNCSNGLNRKFQICLVRNVKRVSRFFSNRCLDLDATSLRGASFRSRR